MAAKPQTPDPVQLNLLEENSKWVKENYPELSKSMKETDQDKARAKAAENEEYKDKRTPKSDLIRQAELDKMKEILNKPKGVSGGSGSMGTGKMNRDITKSYKKGGTASSRADGCCIRGKTRA